MRILINNEEVVCDKELTITEQMLNTSSTILKNCYPLSWETTKDYTQYYYPEDYSKCIIYGEGQSVDFTINGSTSQSGIPTPTNPIPVLAKTGTITQTIGGTDYTFDLGNIKLFQLGEYQDYIYKRNGNWYKHQVIEGYIFTGAESWQVTSAQEMTDTIYLSSNILDGFLVDTFNGVMSDRFVSVNNLTNNDVQGIEITTSERNIRLRIDKTIATDSATFKTWLSNNNVTMYYPLQTPIDVLITDTNLIEQLESVDTKLLFCGIAKRTGNINLNPRDFHGCDIQILDFKDFLSQGETLDFVINNKTVLEAIQMVISAVSDYGIELGNVNINGANDTIGAYSTADKTAYDVFNYLADITQSRWTTRLVDENTIAVDFYDPEVMPSGTPLSYTQQFFEDNNIVDISYNYSTADYRNKQVMLSKEVYADIDYNEQFIADGYAKVFNTENNIAAMGGISVNGTTVTVATKEEKELGLEADFYYSVGKTQLETDNLYIAGTVISVRYLPLVQGRQVIYNNDEVDRISTNTGRKGVVARYENRNDALSSDELLAIGNSYIRYKGSAEITLVVETQNIDLWNVGQKVSANSFPLSQLNTTYMVKSKETNMILTTGDIFYRYTLSSSFNSENEINYFDNQRAKASGNIKSGDFIDRNIDIEEGTLIIFNNLNIDEVVVDGDNVLNCALNSPLIK